jgi:FHA domain/von Willebrand factor type A domain
MKNMPSSLRALLCAWFTLCVSAVAPAVASAQTGGVTLSINSCDSTDYPNVMCIVTPVNSAGVPLQQLDGSSFQVMDGTKLIPDIQVEKVISPSVKGSVLLLVDFGMIRAGENLQPLKDSATAILQAVSNDDRVALIAITAPVDVTTNLDPTREIGFGIASQNRDSMNGLITKLNAVGRTPLYDGVCKALLLAAKEEVGKRSVIVLSDGVDVGSQACTDADTVDRAGRDHTPVFTIGVGTSIKEDYMRRLASQTGGEYGSAAQVQNIIDVFKRFESGLKTEYKFTIHMPDTGNGQLKAVDIRVTQGADNATARAEFMTPSPEKPQIQKVTFTIDGASANPRLLPANKTVVIEPTLNSQSPVAQVEYLIGNDSKKFTDAPYQLVIPTNDLIGLNKITINATGVTGRPESVATMDIAVNVEPPPLTTPTPAPSLLRTLTTFPGVLILVVFVLLLLVLILLVVMLARRRRSSVPYVASSSPTMIVSTPAVMEQSPPTSLLNDTGMDYGGSLPVGSGGETISLRPPIATLEFTSGDLAGKRFPIGTSDTQVMTIGREPDPGPNSVRINSKFVSRKHATITLENGAMFLTDLNSSSGTKLNGERLVASQRRDVKIGDKIEFADASAEIKQA